jgi:putative hydrolase of the HAD superfamily
MKDSRELLLFDLGGVLLEYSGVRDIHGVLSEQLTREETLALVQATSDTWAAFETGMLTPEAFAEHFAAHWPLGVPQDVFLAEFESWTRALYPGAAGLLDELRDGFRLAALSNTNALHWRRMRDVLGIPRLFERAFASHELGVRKPSPEVYVHVLREMGVAPGQATFFDDVEANVEAARRVGMRAYRVEGVDALRACLVENGYLEWSKEKRER